MERLVDNCERGKNPGKLSSIKTLKLSSIKT